MLGIRIVNYDWLEDSLLSLTRRPKGEGPYLLKNNVKAATEAATKKATTSKASKKVVKSQPKPKAPKRPMSMSYSDEYRLVNALILNHFS
jgi:hypothetical protein